MISERFSVAMSKSCFRLALSFDRLACVLVSMYCFLIFPITPSAKQSCDMHGCGKHSQQNLNLHFWGGI